MKNARKKQCSLPALMNVEINTDKLENWYIKKRGNIWKVFLN